MQVIDLGAVSAYALAVEHGYVGTEEEWVAAQQRFHDESAASATAAAASATQAAESAAAIGEKATEASNNAKLAESYAVGTGGARENEAADNAKKYAEDAAASAAQASAIAGGDFIPMSAKGAANGVATLDDTGKVPLEQIPSDVGKVQGVKGSAETDYRTGNVDISPADIGLGNVPNVTTDDQTPTFTQASTRENIASGNKLSVIFGKIMKWYTDLKAVAFSGSYDDLSDKPSIPDAVAVKGNAESSYRTGNVNITADNVGAISEKSVPDSQSLNSIKSSGFYYAGGGNTVPGKPTDVGAFGLIVLRSAGGSHTQILYDTANRNEYTREYINNAWTAWVQTVKGIKGNAETSYRNGNVNLTPANIGALAADGNAVSATNADKIDGYHVVVLSETAYNSLATKDANTIYYRYKE